MSREIKFRVWDKKNKCFIDEYYDDNFMYTLSFSGDFVYAYKTHKVSNCPNWELMQYTGIKDKNGVEIYEGDIMETKEEYVDEVVQSSCGKWLIGGFGGVESQCETSKVIGNIYQSPELLEKQ